MESVHIEWRAANLEGIILDLSKAAKDGSLTDASDVDLDKLLGKNLNPNGVLDLRSNAKPIQLIQASDTI